MQAGNTDPCPCGSGNRRQFCCGRQGLDGSPAVANLFVLLRQGRHAELERSARKIALRQPKSGIVWKLLAAAHAMQRKNAIPALTKAAHLLPDDAEAHANLGNALGAARELEAAVRSYRRAIAIDPHHAGLQNSLGNTLMELGRPGEAIENYRRAVEIEPDSAVAHGSCGNALRYLGQLDAAQASYRQALALNGESADAHYNLAIVLRLQNRVTEAEAHCRKALQINPDMAPAIVLSAKFLADRGQFQESEEWLRRAIALEPESPDAWGAIPHLRKMRPDDTAWLEGALRIAGKALAPRRESRLRFAIGKYFDDTKDYPQAFQNYRRANELAKSCQQNHDMQALARTVDLIIRSYDPAWVSRNQGDGIASSRPIFIVGMPRSGTTLAEQILAAHPAVFGANELGYWGGASAAYLAAMKAGENLGKEMHRLADEYLGMLEGLSADALRVVDKMPANFLSMGFIHAALPNARFIHLERNPIDTCLSLYFQDFDATYSYANELDHLAHYYGEYLRVMKHWRSVVPAELILDVSYEELVDDHEFWGRKMLEFIGLAWDPRCSNFHETSRIINTASNWQVRQRINKSAVQRWRNYEQFLGPLLHLARASAIE
jgi:tetratricopeptide (TPR) repeat protein